MGVAKAETLSTLAFLYVNLNRTFAIKTPLCYNVNKGGQAIWEIHYIAIDEYERRIIIGSLNNLRNKLIADGRYTDVVDDVLVKSWMHQSKNSKSGLRRFNLWKKHYLSKWAKLITRKTGILSPTLPYTRRRKTYRDMGTAAFAVSEGTQKDYIY